MQSLRWKDVAEFVGVAAIVGSLIFVGLQLKQGQDVANADRRQSRAAYFVELTDSINAHPDIWSRGTSGAELSEAEQVVFSNLIDALDEYHFLSASAASTLGAVGAAKSIRADFVGFLIENPGALQTWNARQDTRLRYRDALAPDGAGGRANWVEAIRNDLKSLK